jgi:hypothetical protein
MKQLIYLTLLLFVACQTKQTTQNATTPEKSTGIPAADAPFNGTVAPTYDKAQSRFPVIAQSTCRRTQCSHNFVR